MKGKAADDPHSQRAPSESGGDDGVPKVSVDYGFIKLEDTEPRTVLVLKVSGKGPVMARCVTGKGREDPTAIPWIVAGLRRLGLGRCLLQADGEPAMRLLVREVIEEACRATALGIASAHSPAYDHRANGAVERAIREVKDQTRVLYSALTAKVGHVPLDCPVIEWLVEMGG